MNKRVHEIAKERGVAAKEVLAQLQAAGLKVKAVSSSVDEADAIRVLGTGTGNGQAAAEPKQTPSAQRAVGGERPQGTGERSQDRPARPRSEGRGDAPEGRADAPAAHGPPQPTTP